MIKLLFTGYRKEVEWEIKDKFSDTIDIIKVPTMGATLLLLKNC